MKCYQMIKHYLCFFVFVNETFPLQSEVLRICPQRWHLKIAQVII